MMTDYQIVLEVYVQADNIDDAVEQLQGAIVGGYGYEIMDVFEDES